MATKSSTKKAGQGEDGISPTSKGNLNTASMEDIMSLPFMNEQRARLIISYRDTHGGFEKIEDVDNVTGIGDKLAELVKQHFEVG